MNAKHQPGSSRLRLFLGAGLGRSISARSRNALKGTSTGHLRSIARTLDLGAHASTPASSDQRSFDFANARIHMLGGPTSEYSQGSSAANCASHAPHRVHRSMDGCCVTSSGCSLATKGDSHEGDVCVTKHLALCAPLDPALQRPQIDSVQATRRHRSGAQKPREAR